VPAGVPKLGPTTVKRQPTPTNDPIKNGPEIVNFRPVLGSWATLANRRLQPLGHLTADVKVYVKSGLTGSLFSVAKAAVFRTAVNAGFPRESAILGIDSGHTRREAVKNLPDADAGWLKKL
jgi:hypothetical protein